MPAFIDYLFLFITNSTGLSPTDTPSLSERMKLVMMLQVTVSLLTVALVAAIAANGRAIVSTKTSHHDMASTQ